MTKFIFALLFLGCFFELPAQISSPLDDDADLYATTKQVNQFFRRFNNEEDARGKKYARTDKRYRNNNSRKPYIMAIFNNQNTSLSPELKNKFINDVMRPEKPIFLDFHGGRWFAEVQASFVYDKKVQDVTLFLNLEDENLGSKWVINYAYFPVFDKLFYNDLASKQKFLHPLSHELDFMNLRKVFQEDMPNAEYFTNKDFYPNHLTLFLYELKRRNLTFQSVKNVKFHFFQVDNWYFELSKFNRKGYNKGWLISNLFKIPEQEKAKLMKFIHKEQK